MSQKVTSLQIIYERIVSIEIDDIEGLMKAYDDLSSTLTDVTTRQEISKIYTRIFKEKAKLQTDISNLKEMTYQKKKNILEGLLLDYEVQYRGHWVEETDILRKFIKEDDVATDDQKISLGIDPRFTSWPRENVITELENIIVKCICSLDVRMKEFILTDTRTIEFYNEPFNEERNLLLYKMRQLMQCI
jgi:hypothetical protein